MKDKHNVILILVSSSELNSLFRRLIKFSVSIVSSSLFPGVPTFYNYFTTEIHLNRYKDSPCVFNFFSFRLIILLFNRVLHEGSTWWFIKDLIPSPSFSSTFFSKKLKLSSYCNLECNSFYRIIGGGIMSFLIIWVHFSWFTCCQEWDILNPSISSLELPWLYFT